MALFCDKFFMLKNIFILFLLQIQLNTGQYNSPNSQFGGSNRGATPYSSTGQQQQRYPGQQGFGQTGTYGQTGAYGQGSNPMNSQYGQTGSQYGSRNSQGSQLGYGQNQYGQNNPYNQQRGTGQYGMGSGMGNGMGMGTGQYGTGTGSMYNRMGQGQGYGQGGGAYGQNPYSQLGQGHMGAGENLLGTSMYTQGVTAQPMDVMNQGMPMNGNGCQQIILPPYAKFLYGTPCNGMIGSRCYLTCQPGYDLIGSCFRVCGQDRRWSGSEMLCVRPAITCPPLNINNNIRILSGCQNMAGFSCILGCKTGGQPMANGLPLRNGMIFCQVEGRWSTDPMMVTCGAGGAGMTGLGTGLEGTGQMNGQRNGMGMGSSFGTGSTPYGSTNGISSGMSGYNNGGTTRYGNGLSTSSYGLGTGSGSGYTNSMTGSGVTQSTLYTSSFRPGMTGSGLNNQRNAGPTSSQVGLNDDDEKSLNKGKSVNEI